MDQGSSTGGISRWWPGSGIPSRFDADLLWVQSAESMTAWGRGADQAVLAYKYRYNNACLSVCHEHGCPRYEHH